MVDKKYKIGEIVIFKGTKNAGNTNWEVFSKETGTQKYDKGTVFGYEQDAYCVSGKNGKQYNFLDKDIQSLKQYELLKELKW